MICDAMPYGYRILGTCDRERKLINHDEAFAAYADCDDRAEIDKTAFLSAFQYDNEIYDRVVDDAFKLDTSDFHGRCWSRFVWFDIDDKRSIETATESARRICSCLMTRYGLDESELLVFFSGAKGFHVGLPTSLSCRCRQQRFTQQQDALPRALRRRHRSQSTLRFTARYSLFEPRTADIRRRDATSGLLQRTSCSRFKQLPSAIVRVSRCRSRYRANQLSTSVRSMTGQGVAAGEQKAELAVQLSANRTALNRATLEFIRDGAAKGERHTRLFSTAANLAEFWLP